MRPDRFPNGMNASQMKLYLDDLALKYNNPSFIKGDPISIPHRFSDVRDIESSAFLTATIAWGRRDLIIRSATRLMTLMGDEPYKFIMGASEHEIEQLSGFVHRTFNGTDAISFVKCLRNIYSAKTSMEFFIAESLRNGKGMQDAIINLRKNFFSAPHPERTERHLSDVSKNSAGKKINMFVRWMVRSDEGGVDFGIWKSINPSELFIPLDIHAGNTARYLGLLTRRQNDWKATEELTMLLREFDQLDPVKYDFALFGAGVNGETFQ
jgi:uncharacterized protein (TIGR02757 family)